LIGEIFVFDSSLEFGSGEDRRELMIHEIFSPFGWNLCGKKGRSAGRRKERKIRWKRPPPLHAREQLVNWSVGY
jgi:hypothetical protein